MLLRLCLVLPVLLVRLSCSTSAVSKSVSWSISVVIKTVSCSTSVVSNTVSCSSSVVSNAVSCSTHVVSKTMSCSTSVVSKTVSCSTSVASFAVCWWVFQCELTVTMWCADRDRRIPGAGLGWHQLPGASGHPAWSGSQDGQQDLPHPPTHHARLWCSGRDTLTYTRTARSFSSPNTSCWALVLM